MHRYGFGVKGRYATGVGAGLALVLTAGVIHGQSNSGSISGTVADPSGAVIAMGQVSVKNQDTGTTYKTVTGSSGAYLLPQLQVGTYTITVSAPGFNSRSITGISVDINRQTSINVQLSPGGTSETVTVDAGDQGVQTTSSEVGTVVQPRQVDELPLSVGGSAARSARDFTFLTPGTVGIGTSGGDFQVRIAGSQTFGSEVLLDGGSIQVAQSADADSATNLPSVDAIREFNILLTGLPAQMGRTTGGVSTYTTASGINAFHGKAYEIFRNTDLDANTWFNNANLARSPGNASFQRPQDKKNEFGGTFGGPLIIPHVYNGHNKTFFFFSWEQYRQTRGGVNTESVPSLANRAGDFSANLVPSNVLGVNPCDGQPIVQGEIFDPSTTRTVNGTQCRSPFPNNTIPKSTPLSATALKVLALFPEPIANAATSPNGLINNYVYSYNSPILNTLTTIRIDETLSPRDVLFASYNSRNNTQANVTPYLPGPIGAGEEQSYFTHYVRVGYDHVFSPVLLNHLNLAFSRVSNFAVSAAASSGTDYSSQLGLSGLPPQPGFPVFNIGEGLPQIGDDTNQKNRDNLSQVDDLVNWSRGKHEILLGTDLRYRQFEPNASNHALGSYFFGRGQTAATPTTMTYSGNGLASFLLGDTSSASATVYARQPKYLLPYLALFGQDNVKVTPSLTLTLGLRWSVDVPPYESASQTSSFEPNVPNPGAGGHPGALVFAGTGPGRSGRDSKFAATYYGDYEPRLGFSWAPSIFHNATAFRGNYDIFYGPLQDFQDLNGAGTGFTASPNPNSSATGNFSAAFPLDSPFPAYAAPPNFDPAQLNGGSIAYKAASYGRPPKIQQWNFEVQQQLAKNWLLDLGYLGQHSTRLRSNLQYLNNLNPSFNGLGQLLTADVHSPAAIAAGIVLPYSGFTGTVAQALRPFPQYTTINSYEGLENIGQASYNGLLLKLEKRFTNGLSLLVSYTWSKTLTDADSALTVVSPLPIQNPYNLKGEKAVAQEDIPQNLVISYLYELPFGKNKAFFNRSSLLTPLIGGWQVNGIQRYNSGQGVQICCGGGIPGTDTYAVRYNIVPGQSKLSAAARSGHFNPFTDFYYNPAAYADPNPAARIAAGGAYEYGDAPRIDPSIRTFNNYDEDLSLIKRTQIFESLNTEFRVEAFNVFNRHIFGGPSNYGPGSPGFGQVSSTANAPRQVQLQLRLNF